MECTLILFATMRACSSVGSSNELLIREFREFKSRHAHHPRCQKEKSHESRIYGN